MSEPSQLRHAVQLLDRCRDLGGREALRYFDGFRLRRLSGADLIELVERFNALLEQVNAAPGERMVLWGRNTPEWVAAFWAAAARGVVVVPIDPGTSAELAGRFARRAEARLALFDGELPGRDLGLAGGPLESLVRDREPRPLPDRRIEPDDVLEIVYTSGTTGQPKGVVHRHRNLVANLNPVAAEIDRYRWLATPFQPVRILNQLPLSHLFGQALALFVPPLLGGASVLTRELKPSLLVETIRRNRVSVLVGVPRQMQQLQHYLENRFGAPPPVAPRHPLISVPLRWWRTRRHHRALGLKFWAVVVGGARVDEELEEFWDRLGIVLVQGYGLTEASPIVALNHPFHRRRGSLGQAVAGQEIRIDDDGEILVRGENVVSAYDSGETPVDDDGWLHTGDLGAIDAEGRLYFKGRKKDVIVRADGLNVFPGDVEDVLDELEGVVESVAVGVPGASGEEVCGVVLAGGQSLDTDALRRQANGRLEAHQRLKELTVWPDADFPRTSTGKVRRVEVRRQLIEWAGRTVTAGEEAGLVRLLIAEAASQPTSEIAGDSHLERDLGLSSLDRVELLSRLELALLADLDELEFSRLGRVDEVEAWVHRARGAPAARTEPTRPGSGAPVVRPPRWSRLAPVRAFRGACQALVFLPLLRRYLTPEVSGSDHLEEVAPPVLFAANHNSHLDTVAVLAALPKRFRRRLAPAVRQEFFFEAGRTFFQRFRLRALYWLAGALFNAYPLPQRSGGIRQLIRYTGELADAGFCPLIFPEGRRSDDGLLLPFQPGVGMLASRLELPVVPVYLEGLFEVLSKFDSWPRSTPIRVRFGQPLLPQRSEAAEEFTARLRESFAAMEQAARS